MVLKLSIWDLRKMMTKINPNDLDGARTYFTGFDTKSYVTKNKQVQQEILERTLKVLLLTKNKIVFGASHLKNDLAIDLVQKEPLLFERNLIIPALRNEHNGDLSKVINSTKIDSTLFNTYVGWDLKDNTTWFREQILNGFKYENSILRNNFQYTNKKDIKSIVNMLDNSKYFDREISDANITDYIHEDDLKSFNMYQNLIYNISGARVVNCESSLDQENMIYDYSLSDIENRKVFLSDVEIFHRIFVEQVFNTIHKKNSIFNISFIDALEFSDVIDLREKIDDTNFISKYSELITKSSELIEKKDFIDLYSLEELLSISDSIHKNFKTDIENEVDKYLNRQQRDRDDKAIWEPIYNIIKSLNPMSSYTDNGENILYLTRNVYNKITTNKEQNNYLNFINHQDKVAKDLIKNMQIDNATSLVGVSSLLKKYIYEKYEIF